MKGKALTLSSKFIEDDGIARAIAYLSNPKARAYLEQTLEKEAEEKIKQNRKLQDEVEQKIADYNQAITGINSCLQGMLLNRYQLPVIGESDLRVIPSSIESEDFDASSNSAPVSSSNDVAQAL